MPQQPYSVQQVADLLGLHVKTVRNYVRDGRLKAVRIGKQYRIAREDLEAFTGRPVEPPARETAGRRRRVEFSGIVQVDAIGPEEVNRLATMLSTAVTSRPRSDRAMHVQTVYDEERAVLKVVVMGDPEGGAELLRVVAALAGEGL
ncbi:helix-turn-helix domain-containing protein [Planomonospora alba]|uniref:Helix-turn-helix domain-containing protein n=1 Tax=Planomonospora alba TaxID=161354 RepID=A0ABP6N408_9ACTN